MFCVFVLRVVCLDACFTFGLVGWLFVCYFVCV